VLLFIFCDSGAWWVGGSDGVLQLICWDSGVCAHDLGTVGLNAGEADLQQQQLPLPTELQLPSALRVSAPQD
jgi:hypothetical protein